MLLISKIFTYLKKIHKKETDRMAINDETTETHIRQIFNYYGLT